METDRELLELAAKAAGIKLHVWGTKGAENFADMDAAPFGKLWNPLTDDGDALRLAVKLHIQVMPQNDGRYCACRNFSMREGYLIDAEETGDPYTATRRAIVRAAAEIGKAMP